MPAAAARQAVPAWYPAAIAGLPVAVLICLNVRNAVKDRREREAAASAQQMDSSDEEAAAS